MKISTIVSISICSCRSNFLTKIQKPHSNCSIPKISVQNMMSVGKHMQRYIIVKLIGIYLTIKVTHNIMHYKLHVSMQQT